MSGTVVCCSPIMSDRLGRWSAWHGTGRKSASIGQYALALCRRKMQFRKPMPTCKPRLFVFPAPPRTRIHTAQPRCVPRCSLRQVPWRQTQKEGDDGEKDSNSLDTTLERAMSLLLLLYPRHTLKNHKAQGHLNFIHRTPVSGICVVLVFMAKMTKL